MRHVPAALIVALMATAPALAAPPVPADANPKPLNAPTEPAPTTLTGIVVAAPSKTPPAIVSTYPAAGATVKPGALILKITFDQKMRPDAWRYDRADDRYPSCLDRPRLLRDEKTFVLLCTVGGAGKFAIQMNGPGDGGFINLADQRASPLLLQFSTEDGASLSTIKDAMKSAGLKDEENPVMDKRPASALASAASTPAP